MNLLAGALALVVGAGVLAFHPGRPLYLEHRPVELVAHDGVRLRATVSIPRWRRKPVPGVVVVHGSGPLTRDHVRGDVRRLARLGFAVIAYDKRGAGASGGVYLRQWGDSAEWVLRRLAADAAIAFDSLSADPRVDTARIGFFGASQASWIIPLAAERTKRPPRFQILLSGAAVSTGVEQFYSNLTGDGNRPPRVSDRSEIERLVLGFAGDRGFDPVPILQSSPVPTLWLFGDRDESVPVFASVRVLDSIRATGNDRHTVVRHANANHALRDVDTGEPVQFWDLVTRWLSEVLAPGRK